MSKKIVIVPTFCESHIVEYQIDNIMSIIDPDYLIYNECLFPAGPENLNNIDEDFLKKYCKPRTVFGFDTDEMENIISNKKKEYPNKTIIHNRLVLNGNLIHSTDHAYLIGVSATNEAGDIEFEKGDVIFPYEADVFLHIDQKEKLFEEINNLKEDESIKTNWIDFIGSQYYVEKQFHPLFGKSKGRKLCIKYGTREYYNAVNLRCTSQMYDMCKQVDITTFHYNWFKPEKFRKMRYEQLKRNSGYWDVWENGIQEIIKSKNLTKQDIRIRNTNNQLKDFVSYFEINHPKEIFNHPCYLK